MAGLIETFVNSLVKSVGQVTGIIILLPVVVKTVEYLEHRIRDTSLKEYLYRKNKEEREHS